MTESDKHLVENCLAGCAMAQKRLYDLYAAKMFGVCKMYAKDSDAAQDILQEGYIKVFQNLHTYNGNGPLEAWIRRIIVHTAIDHYRISAAHQFVNIDDCENTEATFLHPKCVIAEEAYRVLDKEDFQKMLHHAPEGYRVALNMFYLEDYTHKEISGMLGISEGTSKSQVSKAKKFLKKIIETVFRKEIFIYEKGRNVEELV